MERDIDKTRAKQLAAFDESVGKNIEGYSVKKPVGDRMRDRISPTLTAAIVGLGVTVSGLGIMYENGKAGEIIDAMDRDPSTTLLNWAETSTIGLPGALIDRGVDMLNGGSRNIAGFVVGAPASVGECFFDRENPCGETDQAKNLAATIVTLGVVGSVAGAAARRRWRRGR